MGTLELSFQQKLQPLLCAFYCCQKGSLCRLRHPLQPLSLSHCAESPKDWPQRMRQSCSTGKAARTEGDCVAWELRPGGMLVQKRSHDADADAPVWPLIKIKVSHGSYQHELSIPSQSTFGELKRALAQETGLEPREQRLLFRGKEKDDEECLHMAGIKDMSKVLLLEDPASKERKLERMKRDQGMMKACEAVAAVRAEVDKLAVKVSSLESSAHGASKAAERESSVLTELLMVQLLKLDSIEAEGEAKIQRRIEVRRVQSFVEKLDALRARNSNPFSHSSKAASVTTQWETF